jgi:hypothetical protein
MLSSFFKTKPLIDDTSKMWIFDTFYWCIDQLDGDFFYKNSELILPNNSFYPGSVSSVEEMAETIFTNTTKYSGLTRWPLRLVDNAHFIDKAIPQLVFKTRLRGEMASINTIENAQLASMVNYKIDGQKITPTIDIAFHPSQLNQVQDLIAYLVQVQANILVSQHNTIPSSVSAPGGKELLPQTIDLVACFMGFGVIFANTAYQFKGGCGSCNIQSLNRQAALPELETVYALALFCVLKGVDIKQIKGTLKSHLYKSFRQAHKEISLYLQETKNPSHANLLENTK